MELREIIFPTGVAVRIDMHEAYWYVPPQRGKNGISDRMITAHTQRPDSSITDLVIKGSDILNAFFEAEATSEWYITDIGQLSNGARRHAQLMVIRPDPLDLTNRSRAETRPRTIGHTQIHRDTNERRIETDQILPIWCIEEGWDP